MRRIAPLLLLLLPLLLVASAPARQWRGPQQLRTIINMPLDPLAANGRQGELVSLQMRLPRGVVADESRIYGQKADPQSGLTMPYSLGTIALHPRGSLDPFCRNTLRIETVDAAANPLWGLAVIGDGLQDRTLSYGVNRDTLWWVRARQQDGKVWLTLRWSSQDLNNRMGVYTVVSTGAMRADCYGLPRIRRLIAGTQVARWADTLPGL